MAPEKHLREFLEEDQEPFELKHYISDRRRCQIRQPCPKTDLQVKRRKPISRNPRFPSNLCDSSCFFSACSPPDPRKSPLFELRSPGKRQNRVFLQVPARTAAILLEAAARIQKQSSKNANANANAKSKHRSRGNIGFGLFGSVFKRLTNRATETRFSLTKSRSQNAERERGSFAIRTNAVFSERGLDSDSEPSSSSRRRESFEVFDGFGYGNADAGDFSDCDSPFRFILKTSPTSSSGDQTPHFTSPATSPTRHVTQDEDTDETESLGKLREQKQEEQEEDKEQCSPVSVLDPPDNNDEDDEEDEEDHRDLDLQCSFEAVQRAKRRLLQKLRRFEKLAGLNPMELERKLSEQEEEENESEDDETLTLYDPEEDLDEDLKGIEGETFSSLEGSEKDTRRRKWRTLGAWRGFGFEGVDGVVERDFGEEKGEWTTRRREEVEEAATDVEFAIFSFLVEEFSLELVCSCA